jgi:acyl-CoA thioesterase
MYAFDEDTPLEPISGGRYRSKLNKRWFFGDAPNGGFILALAVKAALQELPGLSVITVNAHYLQAATEGDVEIQITALRKGRRFQQLQIAVLQNNTLCIQAQLLCADTPRNDSVETDTAAFPDIAPPRRCIAMPNKDDQFRGRINTLIEPGHYEALQHGSQLPMTLLGWAEMPDKRPVDALSLIIYADAFPRAMAIRSGLIGWIPTLELSVQVLRPAVEGPIASEFTTHSIADGLLEEQGRLWDKDRNLVAVCRQTAAPRIPEDRLCFFSNQ